MIIRSNVHVHCTWCDGKNTAEEMVEAAIKADFTDIGFSSHAHAPFDPTCAGVPDENGYINAINMLKQKYSGKINILLGTERDYFTPVDRPKYDYIIGSVHYLSIDGSEALSVDSSLENILHLRKHSFNDDGIMLAREYYKLCVENAKKYRPEIIGHFDVLTKYNKGNVVFDEDNPLYKEIALQAIDKVLDIADTYGGMVEVNTGAFARGLRDKPYPAPFILRHIAARKGKVIITGDSHSAEAINQGFDYALELLKQIGFKKISMLSNKEFKEFDI